MREVKLSGSVYPAYIAVVIMIAIAIAVSFLRPAVSYSANDISILSISMLTIGVLYAIVIGFVILNVWGRFDSIGATIRKEAASLKNAYLLSLQLSQSGTSKSLGNDILIYTNSVVNRYWRDMPGRTKDEFTRFFTAMKRTKPNGEKDAMLLNGIYDDLKNASSYGADVASYASSKTPLILWALVVVLSVALTLGFIVAGFAYTSQFLAALTLTMLFAAIAVVSVMIYDIDKPFSAGFWVVLPTAYLELEDFVKAHD